MWLQKNDDEQKVKQMQSENNTLNQTIKEKTNNLKVMEKNNTKLQTNLEEQLHKVKNSESKAIQLKEMLDACNFKI